MDLSQSSDWNLSFEQTLMGSDLNNFLVPINFSAQILAIYISTPQQKPTWYTGGWINQLVTMPELVTSSTVWSAYTRRLLLGGNTLLLPNEFSTYQLQIDFPVYFQTAFISIWSFTGALDNDQSILAQVNNTVSDVVTLTENVGQIAEQVQNIITVINVIRTLVGG
jgi:hypothetical protein